MMLNTVHSIVYTMKILIGHVEDAPTFNFQWPQFNRLCCLLVVKPNLKGFFKILF